jgi:hypothetical protein
LTLFHEICHNNACLDISHLGPNGNRDDEVIARSSGAVLALAVLASFRPVMRMISLIKEGVDMRACEDDDVSTLASIPAVRPPLGNEFLSPEGTTTIPAVASLYEDPGLINEVHRLSGNRYDFHLLVIAQKRSELHQTILQGK